MRSDEARPIYRVLRDDPEAGADADFIADDPIIEEGTKFDQAASRERLRRNTLVVIVLSIICTLIFARWRVTTGVILGGALSMLNERWLWSSTSVILGVAAQTGNPRLPQWTATKFLLRYFVIALIAGLAIWSGLFGIAGICIGLASLMGALMIEAGYQFFLTFKTAK